MNWMGTLLLLVLFSSLAQGQVSPDVVPQFFRDNPAFDGRSVRTPLAEVLAQTKNGLPNIMLIGYWPPTNEMLREFSPYPTQNLSGWQGKNWEGRGFNVYSFFPEFPGGLGIGLGDFQVDYQDTSNDFWRIVPQVQPVALLSYGRAYADQNWEIELITRNLSRWIADFQAPLFPTPAPPDASLAADVARLSKFPGDAIVSALRSEVPSLHAFVDDQGAGAYLCEYLGYHLSWYRELNVDSVKFAAHTHIGSETPLIDLKRALWTSLRSLIQELDDH